MSLKELYEFCERTNKIAVIHSGQLVGFRGKDDC